MPREKNKSKADKLFIRADKHYDRGEMKAGFRLMLAAANLGDSGAQMNVGNYYDDATGVRRNRSAALYWYKRAYRRGERCAAHCIGILYRNEGELRRSLSWFNRAVTMGDDEAHLEIGKHYLNKENDPAKAIPHFECVMQSDWVTEAGAEEAARLLVQAKRRLGRMAAAPRRKC
jgi:TPR repeat protein